MMISIVRKNLSPSFFSNPNFSYLCNSNSHLRRRLITTHSPQIYDVFFQKHQFSSEFASSLASAHLTKFATPERADSVLSFMKENSFTNAQLERIVRYKPQILGFAVEDLLLKLKIFRDLGLSSEEVAEMMRSNQMVLYISTKNNIIPKLSILKALLGSDQDVARLLRKSAWFLKSSDLNNTLLPNIEILKSSGLPMERVLHFLHSSPRLLLIKPDIMKKSVEKAIEFGVPLTSLVFIRAVGVIAQTSPGVWGVKLKILRDFGFSEAEILSMFRKQPMVFGQTGKKMESVLELLVGTGKYSISDFVANPSALAYSIKKRLEPRLQVLALLESRSLIEKRPGLGEYFVEIKMTKFSTNLLGLIMMRSGKNTPRVGQEGMNPSLYEPCDQHR